MWRYKIVNPKMIADFIEIYVEFTSPEGDTFTKMYSFTTTKTESELTAFIEDKIRDLIAMKEAFESIEENMAGQEFSYGGDV